jgi:hypothetical protein
LAIVSQTDLGASITNAAEDIHAALSGEFGAELVVLEHCPAGSGAPAEEHLDQVALDGQVPRWRRIWPTPHDTYESWMREHGDFLLRTHR